MKTTSAFPESRHSLLVPPVFEEVCASVRRGALNRGSLPAYTRLLREAEAVLSCQTETILQKTHVPPSGDKRDYFSLSSYFWPNPDTADGLPYIPRDGELNPETHAYDRFRLATMVWRVDTLSLAYALSGNERFAARAAELLRCWFVREETRMNPNMLFAQYIPGDQVVLPWKEYPARFVPGSGGRKGVFVSFGGVIEGLELVPLIDCARILRASEHWAGSDDDAMRTWFRDYAEWLLTHQHGKDEASCRNNHGSWYWAEIVSFLCFTDQQERARSFVETVLPERLRLQVEPDGSQPEELVRAISLSYTVFTLNAFTNLALAAEGCGCDLWSFETDDGRSVRKALDWTLPYLVGETEWSWRQIQPFPYEQALPVLSAFARATGEGRYREAMGRLPSIAADERFRLLYMP